MRIKLTFMVRQALALDQRQMSLKLIELARTVEQTTYELRTVTGDIVVFGLGVANKSGRIGTKNRVIFLGTAALARRLRGDSNKNHIKLRN